MWLLQNHYFMLFYAEFTCGASVLSSLSPAWIHSLLGADSRQLFPGGWGGLKSLCAPFPDLLVVRTHTLRAKSNLPNLMTDAKHVSESCQIYFLIGTRPERSLRVSESMCFCAALKSTGHIWSAQHWRGKTKTGSLEPCSLREAVTQPCWATNVSVSSCWWWWWWRWYTPMTRHDQFTAEGALSSRVYKRLIHRFIPSNDWLLRWL